MLLIIAAAGILITIAACRKPEVTFFSVVTIFNRKEKLTETGARLYVGFFVLLLIGIFSNFLRASPPAAAASIARQHQAENAEAAAPATKEAQFAEMTRYFEMEAETMASIIPDNGMAEGQMELCNSFVQGGLMDYKADHDVHRLHVAVRDCHQMVLKACAESVPANAGHCEEYKANTQELRNW